MYTLGVLDQSPIPEGSTAGQALKNSLELARHAEAHGYARFWMAEHHGTPALACNSPEAVLGIVGSQTSRIHIGSGGIMLPHYSPLKVAETFSMLAALNPGRVDLGIGRAAGTSPNIAFALQRDRRQRAPDDFLDQLEELLGYFEKSESPAGSLPVLTRHLPQFHSPAPYLLGSSPQSAIWAARLGLPYVFADFINANGAEIVDYYRRAFQPSRWSQKPHVIVASWTVAADTDEAALRLSASSRMLFHLLHQGRLVPVPTVEQAESFLRAEGLPMDVLPPGRRMINGTPASVRQQLDQLAEEYGQPEEFLLVNILHDHAARLHSYRLVAEYFHLAESQPVELAETAV
jgi:luciferase family oxidoreductase group 1